MFRTHRPLSPHSRALVALALALSPFAAHAQTPTSNVYAFTNLHDQLATTGSNLGGNSTSQATGIASNGVSVGQRFGK